MRLPLHNLLFRSVVLLSLIIASVAFSLHYDNQEPSRQEESQTKQKSENVDSPKSFIGRTVDDPTAFFTATLALLTSVLAAVGVAQVFYLNRSDQTARKSAEAALKSANVAVAQSRPWISYNKVAIGGNLLLKSSVAIATIDFTIKNYGHIPANDVVIFGKIVHDDAEKAVDEVNEMSRDFRRNPVYIGKSLFPGDEIVVHCHFMGDMSDAFAAVDYYGENIPFIIAGRIDYRSTLVSENHFTNFTLHVGRRDEAVGINPYSIEVGRDILFVTEWFRGPIAN